MTHRAGRTPSVGIGEEETPMADNAEMTLAFTGNVYIEHPVSQYRDQPFLKTIELIIGFVSEQGHGGLDDRK